jgi:hypothetical protein
MSCKNNDAPLQAFPSCRDQHQKTGPMQAGSVVVISECCFDQDEIGVRNLAIRLNYARKRRDANTVRMYEGRLLSDDEDQSRGKGSRKGCGMGVHDNHTCTLLAAQTAAEGPAESSRSNGLFPQPTSATPPAGLSRQMRYRQNAS